jgi:transcriptional regulator with XRE-family HTH domain
MATIGDTIRRLRKSRGLTQVQLAEQLGTIQKVITDYETGKTRPPSERLPVIARFFGVTIDELIGARDIETPPPPANGNGRRHGNSRSAKLLSLFDQLSPEEQRTTLKQIRGIIADKQRR